LGSLMGSRTVIRVANEEAHKEANNVPDGPTA
jgi:hypothetical protein